MRGRFEIRIERTRASEKWAKSCKVARCILRVEIRNDANRWWAYGGIRMWFKCGRVSSVISWTRGRTAPRQEEVFKSVARAKIRIRIDVSSDTCLRIENRYAAEGAQLAWTGKKYLNFSTSRMWWEPPLSHGVWTEWFIYGAHGWMRALDMRWLDKRFT